MEKLADAGKIDLFYGDETHVSRQGYVPSGWHFPREQICTYVEKGYQINVFGLLNGLLNKANECHWISTENNINSGFMIKFLATFAMQIKCKTVLVLDNARVHHSQAFEQARIEWEKQGLYFFFLPVYSPHLNRAEIVWRILKAQWIDPMDYLTPNDLNYAVSQAMNAIGTILNINFTSFNIN